jgi:16S rRNA (adenine1518-N6/adenine1519-N6)-dimethyltransferase
MQTKRQIEQLLGSAGVKPNQRLGQNFLIDLNLMRLLIGAAHISRDDIVLEVGCGTGSFTEGLAKAAGLVITVECDKKLVEIAARKLEAARNIKIINADILENKNTICHEAVAAVEKARGGFGGKFKLVANLPYNVAASVMMNLIVGPPGSLVVDSMCVTVQKEVGQRMIATPGSGNYGVLGIFMAATGQAQIMRKLKPSVFWPRPEVDSVMVRFKREEKKAERIHDPGLFKEVVNLFMGHRRKMLQACVKFAAGRLGAIHDWHGVFARAFVEPHRRGEELGADEYISMANICNEQL